MRSEVPRWFHGRGARARHAGAWILGAVLLLEGIADAEVFRYVDRDGVAHEINVAGDPAPGRGPVAADPPAEAASYPHAAAVREAAQLYSLPVELILAVMTVESGFDPRAVSPRGAMGLMQLMPGTATEMHVTDPFDPRENMLGGARYLRILVNGANGDVVLALAGYHAGAGATQRHGGVPPFPETHRYVASVVRIYHLYQERGPGFAAALAKAIHSRIDVGHEDPRAARALGVARAEKAVIRSSGSQGRPGSGNERARPLRPMKRRRGSG